MKFTQLEMKQRAILRVAQVIHGQWEEERGVHSRIFEVLVPDEFVTDGESVNGNNRREHVVPCCLIRNHANDMYSNEASIDEVASMIEKYLRIVKISSDERRYIDYDLGLKDKMPNGWCFGSGDPLARLYAGNIKLKEKK